MRCVRWCVCSGVNREEVVGVGIPRGLWERPPKKKKGRKEICGYSQRVSEENIASLIEAWRQEHRAVSRWTQWDGWVEGEWAGLRSRWSWGQPFRQFPLLSQNTWDEALDKDKRLLLVHHVEAGSPISDSFVWWGLMTESRKSARGRGQHRAGCTQPFS